MYLCIKLLSGLDGRGLWLIIHLLKVSPHPQEWSFSAGNVDCLYLERRVLYSVALPHPYPC